MSRHPKLDLLYKPLRAANRLVNRATSMRVMRDSNLYPWQLEPKAASTFGDAALPPGAREFLTRSNPRLVELEQRYRTFDSKATRSPVWTSEALTDIDLQYFRGHNAFTDQLSGLHANELTYALTYYAVKSSSAADLLARIDEDGAFGANVFAIDGRSISREVLDSSREIDFLRRHVGWDKAPLNLLDIGAGYGRLVHRLRTISEGRVRAFATDAYAPSTFLSEYYLSFRGIEGPPVIPLDEVEKFIAATPVDIATNIHSFSECSVEAIDWWLSRLAANRVKYLMIVPNRSDEASGDCLTNRGENIDAVCAANGYRLLVREPAHDDPAVQKYAVDASLIGLFVRGD